MPVSASWLKALPKAELHCHLDGSVSPDAIAVLAERGGLTLPAHWREQLRVSADCSGLPEYLSCFDLPLRCLQTADALAFSVTDVARQLAAETVRYAELRFAPLSHTRQGLSCREVLEAVICGGKQATAETGVLVAFIVCAMRHETMDNNLAMLETAADFLGRGVCALDLAGDETAYPNALFRPLFERAAALDMPFTIHAGECGSTDNVRDALSMGARRVGHGIALRQDEALMAECRAQGVVVELCPTSNFQTKAAEEASYPLGLFRERGLKVTLNTDNRTVSGTTLTDELRWTADRYALTESDVAAFIRNAIDGAFADDAVKQRLRQEWEEYDAGSRQSQ